MNFKIISKILFLVIALGGTSQAQETRTLTITGSFWDYNTGIDISNTSVYVIINKEKVKIAESDNTGSFSFKLPTSSNTLVFEATGYNIIQFPISFRGDFQKENFANLRIKTLPLGENIKHKNKLIYCYPTDYKKEYTYTSALSKPNNSGESYPIKRVFDSGRSINFDRNKPETPHARVITISDSQQKILLKREFQIPSGTVFLDLSLYSYDEKELAQQKSTERVLEKTVEVIQENSVTPEIPSNEKPNWDKAFTANKTIYFDQGDYKLSNQARSLLDSISYYLKTHQEKKININAYTDNVGKESRNLTLSQYRAKTVTSYLQSKGIKAERLNAKWEVADEQMPSNLSEQERSKFRKVVLTEL